MSLYNLESFVFEAISRDHDTFALLLQNLTMEQNPPRIFTRRNYLELNKFEIYVGIVWGFILIL